MIHWCTNAHVIFDKINETRHFDIMNLQDYDIILGTPFLFQHKISIALNPSQVYVRSANSLPVHGEQVSKISSRVIDARTQAIEPARDLIMRHAAPLFRDAKDTPLIRKISWTQSFILVNPSEPK